MAAIRSERRIRLWWCVSALVAAAAALIAGCASSSSLSGFDGASPVPTQEGLEGAVDPVDAIQTVVPTENESSTKTSDGQVSSSAQSSTVDPFVYIRDFVGVFDSLDRFKDDDARYFREREELVRRCVKEDGWEYELDVDFVMGVKEATLAPEYGVGITAMIDNPGGIAIEAPLSNNMAYFESLDESAALKFELRVGECELEAFAKLEAGRAERTASTQLRDELVRFETSVREGAAFGGAYEAWSTCMAAEGFDGITGQSDIAASITSQMEAIAPGFPIGYRVGEEKYDDLVANSKFAEIRSLEVAMAAAAQTCDAALQESLNAIMNTEIENYLDREGDRIALLIADANDDEPR